GNYESELFPFFKEIEGKYYTEIIDIGCAEGYYAAGLALKFSASKIHAFDNDERAIQLCKELCAFNNVGSRVAVSGECSPDLMKQINEDKHNLVICDCEGCERYLFNSSNIGALEKSDLLIELHPMYIPDVKEYLSELFKNTHAINIISSHDDNRKIFDLAPTYNKLSRLEQLLLVQEGRAFSMDWLIAKSKILKR
ncbi:MAG TPA: class I SAM-dependent methyltransferase, partial [Ferruginibacter sp.]|nr:class I SAM-dependent methyltransferase [Ferruginibacter sp.]